MIIKTNIAALRTLGQSKKQQNAIEKTSEKLSSGFQINRAADDAAGLGVSESMRAKITELTRCQQNAKEGIDITNTADGALAEINEMLRRARELCIQGANEIYDESDLNAISDEMNALFDEVDRITAGTRHNDISLFRYSGSSIGMKYEYEETFLPIDPANPLENWGDLPFIQEGTFDRPQKAKPATATITLENGINPLDASTLDGKSITVNGYRFDFLKVGSDDNFPGGRFQRILVSAGQTVEAALRNIATYSNYTRIESVKVDPTARTVTFTSGLADLAYEVAVDGSTTPYLQPDGTGAIYNGIHITSFEGNSIGQVDGSDTNNNRPVYSNVGKMEFTLPSGPFNQAAINNLNRNTLWVGSHSIAFSSLGLTAGATTEQIGQALVNKINNFAGHSASFDPVSKKLSIEVNNLSTTSATLTDVYEQTSSSSGDQTITHTQTLTSSPLAISADRTGTPGPETADQYEITVPAIGSIGDLPKSITVNGTSYCFYKEGSFPPAGYDISGGAKPIPVSPSATADALQTLVMNTIKGRLANSNTNATFEITGNKLKITAGRKNSPLTVSVSGSSSGIYAEKEEINPAYVPGSTKALVFNRHYFTQEVSVPLRLPVDGSGNIDTAALKGTGFVLNSKQFEFVDGAGTGLNRYYTDIDISGITDPAEIMAKIETVLGSDYTVEADPADPGKMMIRFETGTYGNAPIIQDGYIDVDGIFTNPGDAALSTALSGGTVAEKASKKIDFSSINRENVDTLLGKGFRITCATCEGEYVNILFVWKNDGRVPESFETTDPDTGVTRTIHNVAVELSKVSSGDSIVQDIVSQVRPTLKHYTDVEVGNPPTTLVCSDKRIGDIFDPPGTGNLKQAKILSGVFTNFTYSVEKKEVPDTTPVGDGNGLEVEFRKMLIYVGSEPKAQFIPIHLPYLDLSILNLCPPKVDLGDGDQDPFEWLERVDDANEVITTCRGRIGADYNRLDHTLNALTSATQYAVESESRIRDTDMAKEMAEQVKLSILGQVQASMMAQANAQPQQVMQILK